MKKIVKNRKELANIPVLVFRDVDSGEADEVYRLDKGDHAESFFRNLENNIERDIVHHIYLTMYTKEQWRIAELAGLSMNGELSSRQNAQFHQLIKKVKKTPAVQWPT